MPLMRNVFIVTDGVENVGFILSEEYKRLRDTRQLTTEKSGECWSYFSDKLNKRLFIYKINYIQRLN